MELAELFVTLAMDADQYTGELGKTDQQTRSWASGLGTAISAAIAAALLAAAVAVSAFVADSLAEFGKFETGMAEVFTLIPGASQAAMGQMEKDALAAASAMGRLPEEVVPALYQSLSAGVPPDNVFDFLETANAAAIGGVTDLETAVDGITSVVNAYGEEMIDAGQASDLMFTAVRLGKTNFEELSGSLFNVIPTAASLGLEFENVTAALAVMTAQGTPTSVATTQLRQLLVELSKAGSDASLAFERAAGQSFPAFTAAGGDLQTALVMMEQAAADGNVRLSDLFGSVEAGNAALALTGANTETFTAALEEMEGATGATDAAAAQFEGTLERQQAQLEANLAVAKTTVGEGLAPILSHLTQLANELITNVTPALSSFASVLGEDAIPLLDETVAASESLLDIFGEGSLSVRDFGQGFTDGLITPLREGAVGLRYLSEAFQTPLRDMPEFIARTEEANGDLDEMTRILDGMQGELSGASEEMERLEKPTIDTAIATEALIQQYDQSADVLARAEAAHAAQARALEIEAGWGEHAMTAYTALNEQYNQTDEVLARTTAAQEAQAEASQLQAEAAAAAAAAAQQQREAFGSDFLSAINDSTAGQQDWTQALFESASQMGLTQTELVLLAAATGNYTDEQIQAALKTAAMQAKVQELAAELAAGQTTVAEATAELADFEAELDATVPRMTDLSGSAAAAAGSMDTAKAAAMGLTTELNNIPTDVDIRITQTIETVGDTGQHEATAGANAGGGGLGGGGMALGGFTGIGPADEIANFVHYNEFVLNPAATAALGVDFLNRVNQNPDIFRDALSDASGGAARDFAPAVSNNIGGDRNYAMHMQTMAQPADVVRSFRHMERIDRLRS